MSSVLLRALDARVRIIAPDSVTELFAEALADLTVDDDAVRDSTNEIAWRSVDEHLWHVSLGTGGSVAPTDVASGLAESIIEINSLAAASVSTESAVLHAGVFEVNGNAIAVSGVSGAGKSTMIAAAVLRGHGFLADEVCSISPESLVVRPYHRPIGLRARGAAAIGVQIPTHALDPYATVYPWRVSPHGYLADAAPLRLVALAHRRSGPVKVTQLHPAEALSRLTDLTLGTGGIERAMFRRLDQLVRKVPVVTVSYDDSFAAVNALAELVCR